MAIRETSGWMLGMLLSLGSVAARADVAPPMIFRHLTVDEGLAENTVLATLQDSKGFMWFATEDGLDRYDGYSLRHFSHEPGSTQGLPGNYVWAMQEDRSGDLWFAIKDRGVARFDPRTEVISTYRHDARDPSSLSSDATRSLLIDRHGQLWIATAGGGLNILDPATGRVRRLMHDASRPGSLGGDDVVALAEDREGRVWVGTDGGGLDRWSPSGSRFEHFVHADGDPTSLASNRISALYVDATGVLWVGTFDRGLARYDEPAHQFVRFTADANDPSRLGNPEVRALLEDSEHRFWVATAGGLELMDRASGSFTRFKHDPTDPGSLRADPVMSLYQDRTGILWVGTLGGGVSRWNSRSWRFGHVRPPWLANAFAIAFADDEAGALWVGTQGGGLFRYDRRTGAVASADAVFHRPNLLPDPNVMALLRSRTRDLWVGTMKGGLLRITPTGVTTRFGGGLRDRHSLGAGGVMALFEARDGRVWVGTFGGGIAIIDPLTEQVVRVATDPVHGLSGPNPPATAIAQSPDGIVWVGTDGGGLLALHPDGSLAGVWHHRDADPSSLAAETLYALHVDARGGLWAGTDSAGLIQVTGSASKPDSVAFRTITTREGLAGNTIYGIEQDDQGGLWLSGAHGLTRYTPASGDLRRFHRDDGLQGEEFNFAAHFRLRDGRLVFGGAGGFNLFDPQRLLESSPTAPHITLTSVDLKGRPAPARMPYPFLPQLAMTHRDDVASFEFSALDFAAPDKNRYSHRLLGFDDHWSTPDVARRVTYTNLDAGHYVLEVRGSNAEGAWSREALRLPITVEPAPWRSAPAYALYVALAAFLLWSYLAAQRRKLQQAAGQAAALECQVEARTEELRASNVELQRLSRAKSDFLARMSHEIRTPMNGIIGMGEMLMRTTLTEHQVRLARTMHRSAQSLMQILNDILDIAKVEAGRLSISSEAFDLTSVLVETAELFAAQAQDKGIDLIIAPAPDLRQPIIGDPMRIRQILMNLVGNAVKFSVRGEVRIAADVIDAGDRGQRLTLTVADCGIGMPRDVVATIFEPFTQGDESTTRQFGGTGLGLTICRELVELMGGSIEARSELHVGSTFTVTLPLVRDAGSAVPPASPPPSAVIVTGSGTLADAVLRQCAALGADCRWLNPAESGALAGELAGGRRTLVIDVEGCRAELDWIIGECADPGFSQRCTFLGNPAALAELELARRAPTARSAAKPLGPAALSRLLAAPGATPIGGAPPGGTRPARLQGRLLVVEDNPVNTAVFEGLLGELGCSCVTAATGRDAVALAAAERFDAILMDVHMPDMDGCTTTALIRRAEGSERRTPIVALTADAAADTRRRCREAGMDDFLSKPLALEDLRAALARWLPKAADTAPAAALSERTVARNRDLDRAGNGSFLKRLTTLFTDNSARQVDAILEAAAGGDLDVVWKQSHSLKSAAAHVGADGFARLLVEVERAAKASDTTRVGLLTGRLRAERDAAVEALLTELTRRSA